MKKSTMNVISAMKQPKASHRSSNDLKMPVQRRMHSDAIHSESTMASSKIDYELHSLCTNFQMSSISPPDSQEFIIQFGPECLILSQEQTLAAYKLVQTASKTVTLQPVEGVKDSGLIEMELTRAHYTYTP